MAEKEKDRFEYICLKLEKEVMLTKTGKAIIRFIGYNKNVLDAEYEVLCPNGHLYCTTFNPKIFENIFFECNEKHCKIL